jgi:NADH-quinone oxidoreductase subunit D
MIRCVGLKRDLRLQINNTYAYYYYLNIKSYISKNGDSYDRYLLRINEIIESLNIINQTIKQTNSKITKKKTTQFNSMESVIKHFKF